MLIDKESHSYYMYLYAQRLLWRPGLLVRFRINSARIIIL